MRPEWWLAPWTPEQVAALNAWQTGSATHPYTCPNNSSARLVPTADGWVCEGCDYTQSWAHAIGGVQ